MDRGTLLLVALALLAAASVVLGVSGMRIFRGSRQGETDPRSGSDDAGDAREDPT